jgi:hypothetical protein
MMKLFFDATCIFYDISSLLLFSFVFLVNSHKCTFSDLLSLTAVTEVRKVD